MRRKIKIFFEDIGTILIAIGLIYGAYILFFNKDKQEDVQIAQSTIHKTKEQAIVKKQTPKIKKEENNTSKKVIVIPINKKVETVVKKIIESNITKKIEETKTPVVAKKNIKKINIKVLGKFLFNLKSTINNKLVDLKSTHKTENNNFTKIRVTILKDGNYEQLKFVEGDKYFYDAAQNDIKELFPLKIDEKIIDQFPRYFRMTIKY